MPTREELLLSLDGLEPPRNEILFDLWERIVEAYPDWKIATDRHLAVIYGVHTNTLRSRRHALAVVMHAQADRKQAHLLTRCLRLRVGHVRKTDIHKTEHANVTRRELVSKPQHVGEVRRVDWGSYGKPGGGNATPYYEPVYAPLENIPEVPIGGWPTRCPWMDENGKQCTYAAKVCPFPAHKPTI
jgi:hypothetical protein